MTTIDDTRLVEVHLIGLPLDIQARTEEHTEDLMREFSHIAHSTPDVTERIPERLLAVVARLRAEYEPLTGSVREKMEAAREEGRASVDLTYAVPPEVSSAVDELSELLDEADRFCRSGDLLTLATPPESLAYRRWFLGEFKRQMAGEPPIAWSDYPSK